LVAVAVVVLVALVALLFTAAVTSAAELAEQGHYGPTLVLITPVVVPGDTAPAQVPAV
jgi:hypothetical protein